MNNRQASITSGGLSWIVVRFDYDEDLKDELMACVGHGNYRWEKGTKTWSYRRGFYNQVLEIFDAYDYVVSDNGTYRRTAAATSPKALINPWSAICVSMDEVLAHKVYRAVAQVIHPDKGGDTAVMQLVNAVWAEREG